MINPKLLKGIAQIHVEKCKVLLFCIEELIDPKQYMGEDDVMNYLIMLSEDKGNKAVSLVYEGNRKYRLNHPLWIKEEDFTDEIVTKVREVFDKKNTGRPGLKADKHTVELAIAEWRKRNHSATVEEVVKAAEAYIANAKLQDQIIRQVNTFIITDRDCLLDTWLEEIEETSQTSNWRNQVV